MYLVFDPEDADKYVGLATAELGQSFATTFQKAVIVTCTKNETDACVNRPIVNCPFEDNTVIYLKVANETEINYEGSCVTISGKGEELVRATDRAMFQWYEIYPIDLQNG